MPAQFEKWFRVDLSKKAMTEWVGSSFFTNDNLSNIIGVELYDGMDQVDVPGTIQGIIILPNDGTITVNGSRAGNKAWIELPSTALALDGMITITIRATVGDRKVTLVQCSGRVNVTDTGMAIDPDDILPHDTSELMTLIGDLRDVINEYTDIIMVQDTQPDTETNKLWLKKTTPDGVLVPTMEDLEEVGEEVSDLKSAIEQVKLLTNDLSQWLYAENKYINSNYELATLNGYNTYRIPCQQLDFISVTWTGDDPFNAIQASFKYTYEDNNGMSRSLSKLYLSAIDSTGKRLMFIAPANAVALYFTFDASRASNVTIMKNTNRSYCKNIDYYRNFIIPINQTFGANARYTLKQKTGGYEIEAWSNASYLTLWFRAKAGDTLKLKSAVSGQTYNAVFMDTSATCTQITTLSHTFTTDAAVVVLVDTNNPDNAILIPNELALRIDSDNVVGLDDEIDAVADRVDILESYFDPTPHTYSSGLDSGYYYKMVDGVPTKTALSNSSCSKLEVENWMGSKITFSISSLISSVDATYCVFTDENDTFISREARETGSQTLYIPANAKYIYLSFYPSPYGATYTIDANTIATAKDLEKAGVGNGYLGMTGVAFGTSLTYRSQTTGGFLQFLPQISGITFDNQGVGSSFIYYTHGDYNMLDTIKGYSSYANKDVVLVEGFVNDWYNNRHLGSYTDTEENSVCGCVRSALNYIRSQNASATVYLILDHYGRNANNVDMSSTVQNTENKTQYEFYEEVAKVAESIGVRVIKLYSISEINEYTPQYYLDYIHLNNGLGAKQEAYVIWGEMKRYYPNVAN